MSDGGLSNDEFFVPTTDDLTALRLENELLAFENTYLKSQHTEMLRQIEHARAVEEQSKRYKAAYHDLRWLLKRFDGSPAGPLLRRWAGWRQLLQRHLV